MVGDAKKASRDVGFAESGALALGEVTSSDALKALPTPRRGVQFREGNPRTASREAADARVCDLAIGTRSERRNMALLKLIGQSLPHLLVHATFSTKDRRPFLRSEEISQ